MQSTVEDKDLNVLTLYRDGKVFPNPRRERVLEAGDKLLCYGKLEAMRDMIPARTQRKRRPKVQELDTAIATTTAQ
ncbi:hypothetical protein R0135_13495 [Congregibacter variabilis]|uniref:RCK C-terminal domain-containing protein n=1 Tax=Congregibacter variabilis TaxID=3081200 RepID=A0ABZ0I853_9GAMM|nr:hypothetical protein R0135_13495 [Congregibacter sp. IMCC43200]